MPSGSEPRVDDHAAKAKEFERYREVAGADDYEEKLAEAFTRYVTPQELQPGSIVQWKPYLRGGKYPDYGFSAILVRMLSEEEKSALHNGIYGPFAASPDTDCLIGFLDSDETFVVRSAVSARLQIVGQAPPSAADDWESSSSS